jgi:hypothetical protein
VEVRRSKAIGILAQPAQAVQLLCEHQGDEWDGSCRASGCCRGSSGGREGCRASRSCWSPVVAARTAAVRPGQGPTSCCGVCPPQLRSPLCQLGCGPGRRCRSGSAGSVAQCARRPLHDQLEAGD